MNQYDPLYNLREDEPAQHVAVDGDLMDVRTTKQPRSSSPMRISLSELITIAQSPDVLYACIDQWGQGAYAAYWFNMDSFQDEPAHVQTILQYGSERLLEDVNKFVLDGVKQEDVAYAAFVLNDWTGGQFDSLYPISDGREDYYHTLWGHLDLALNYGGALLDENGQYVAERLTTELQGIFDTLNDRQVKVFKGSKLPRGESPIQLGFVYLLQSPTSAYKIGYSKNPANRMKTFGVQLPFEVDYICLIQTDDMRGLEYRLHRMFESKRINGEWFALDPEDVEYIKGLAT